MRARSFLALPLLCLLLCGCSNFIFFPLKDQLRTPAELGLKYEDIYVAAQDGTQLHAWFLNVEGDAEIKGTVFFLHGNAENISTHIVSVYWLPAAGYQVFLLDYRGFGESTGKPTVPKTITDIEAAFNELLSRKEVADKPLYLLGQSLGAELGGYFVATNETAKANLDAVVLDAGFTGYSAIARKLASRSWLTWAFQYPVGWSMPDGYDLIDVVGEISPLPLMIIHGTQDQIIPFSEGEALFAAANQPRLFLRYDGGHIETFRFSENRKILLDYFSQSLRQNE